VPVQRTTAMSWAEDFLAGLERAADARRAAALAAGEPDAREDDLRPVLREQEAS
jgi:hypothetical protein